VDARRFRTRLRAEHPLKINKTKFAWFVSDEVFYDWSLHDWVRNRFGVGVIHAFRKHFTLEVYGMRQNDGRTLPGDINIIGTVWRFRR
jgi:protoporphyrinogen oxidase